MDKYTVIIIVAVLIAECCPALARAEYRKEAVVGDKSGYGWTRRVFTQHELEALGQKDLDLSPSVGLRILAKLNERDFDYIQEDINQGKVLKVPNSFSKFKNWTPMQRRLADAGDLPKLIVVIKNLPFIGWYEYGNLVGDTYTCIGREDGWTRAGVYQVIEKDRNHVSHSYPNAYGEPAPMPWALRVYAHVWIHAGDITGGYCSHGCINLPIFSAMKLFDWATPGTPVVIADSNEDALATLASSRYCNSKLALCEPAKVSNGG